MNNDQLTYGPRQIAKMLGVSSAQVYKMINQGQITAIRFGEKRLLIPHSQLEAVLCSKKK